MWARASRVRRIVLPIASSSLRAGITMESVKVVSATVSPFSAAQDRIARW
jgi:hypothetical protein